MKLSVLLTLLVFLSGCETLSYYTQATTGQLSLLSKRKRIDTLVMAAETEEKTRRQLMLVQSLKHFAAKTLGLPAEDSFSSYVKLERDYPVWSVVATPEFSLHPHQWCYPVIGCAVYRGYFKKAQAERKAQQLKQQGFDVFVAGVPAYSTLGWFNDPVLSSYLYWREADLAGLIFHELAHQVFYIDNDSAINESFASAVEQAGVERWFLHHGRDSDRVTYKDYQLHRKAFLSLVDDTRKTLNSLYRKALPESEKRAEKKQCYQHFRETYLAQYPQGAYKKWVNRELNNAMLASVNTYSKWVPHFLKKLRASQSFKAFYTSVTALEALSVEQRYQQIETWLNEAS